jgi:2'-5' RNA ligase
MAARYAIYYAPDAASALWRFGSSVLGYDARTGRNVPLLAPDGLSLAEWERATTDPRRYGFHATLKAPFRLSLGMSEAALLDTAERIAAGLRPVDLGECGVGVVAAGDTAGFVAVTPASPPDALALLERAVVEQFEPLRAPLDPAERERRGPAQLTERQRQYLDRYGYPYVLEEFAFHMTLSGLLEAPRPIAESLREKAGANGVGEHVVVDRLEVFRQDAREARFRSISTHRLALPRR